MTPADSTCLQPTLVDSQPWQLVSIMLSDPPVMASWKSMMHDLSPRAQRVKQCYAWLNAHMHAWTSGWVS